MADSGPPHSPPGSPGGGGKSSQGLRGFRVNATMPEHVGTEISKRYIIPSREIAAGGYGKVFLAEDRRVPERKVAIKKVVVFDQQKKADFKREVDITKELDHPNICKLLETYEQGRFMFFVMEYCAGGEVFERIMDQGRISEQTSADIVRQVVAALVYAHSRGIAHRDMKPENICFCSENPDDNHVKVIDWGLGFFFGMARMSSAVGSLTYAAPEVLEARESSGYTSACDVWSVGVVTYVMLCGKPPFWGNYQEQLSRMKQESYPMSDASWQAVSRQGKDFIRSVLRAKPSQRPPITEVLNNPWLRMKASVTSPLVSEQILRNMKQFSAASHFYSICVSSVARQLDHSNLRDVHKVFSDLDANGDGVLDVHEVRTGFKKIFGEKSEQLQGIEEMFASLDLDGSGTIDYTEFCAAGIGEHLSQQENVLWAAFKSFDVGNDDGLISKDEIKEVLRRGDVNQVWSPEVCESVLEEVFKKFDTDGDGTINFDEWLRLMRESAGRHANDMEGDDETKQVATLKAGAIDGRRGPGHFDRTYKVLAEMDKKPSKKSWRLCGCIGRMCSPRER
mmetsp:Transcript_8033/g.17411  ORF Transcript_8033/g.17411 Transcript_8033/m.17411 type:complete len:565 (+) Transcript_8033:125-1819(+)